jgi:hypothetical protein
MVRSVNCAGSWPPLSLADAVRSEHFAGGRCRNSDRRPFHYVFVLGVPNLSGAVTASAEAGLQIIRLASVCPPDAKRPHIQEGYLLGEYPDIAGYSQKQLYDPYEIDFGLRLVAKFRFDPTTFWNDLAFSAVPESALYPSPTSDRLCELAAAIKQSIPPAPQ